jgi:hypothetical protein
MTYAALVYPIIAYDAWWYHLPFASYIFNMGGGESAFRLDYITAYRWLGFPKAWEFLQGAAWYITGSLYGVIVPQLAICLIYIFSIAALLSNPIRMDDIRFFFFSNVGSSFSIYLFGFTGCDLRLCELFSICCTP